MHIGRVYGKAEEGSGQGEGGDAIVAGMGDERLVEETQQHDESIPELLYCY